ncbi:MAG: response regulator, partial [Pseudomonadota bacterium]
MGGRTLVDTMPVNILLVEDDEVDIENVRRALRKRKIANPLFVARDGLEALELLEREQVTAPVMILLDINMPRMDGLEFLKRIRKDDQHKNHTVFVLTTSARLSDLYQAYDLSVSGYMMKSDVGDAFIEALELVDDYWRVIE